MSGIELSVVVPAFNEARRLPRTLREAAAWLDAHEPAYELLVVDDGSRDETPAIVERMRAEVPRLRLIRLARNRGKGAAVRTGMLEAGGRFRLFMDADHSTHVGEWNKARARIEAGAAIAIASRRHPDSVLAVRQPRWREALGQGFNRAMRMLTGLRYADTQCGFKAFTAEAAEAIFPRLRIEGFGFDVEILWLADRLGLAVAEFPVRWENDPDSKVRVARDAWRVLADVARIRRLHAGEDER